VFAEIGSKLVRRWLALAGAVTSVVSIVLLVATNTRLWAWLAIGALVLLAASLLWTIYDLTKSGGRVKVLRGLLTTAIREGHGLTSSEEGPEIFSTRSDWMANTAQLLEDAVGPGIANGFRWPPRHHGGMQGQVFMQVQILEDLLQSLDPWMLMEDWQP